ncbi:MAG: hypothetical protein ACJ75F_03640, partial [Flavisolibacter sp.]
MNILLLTGNANAKDFTIFISMIPPKKKTLNKKLIKFYLWMGAGYFVMGILATFHVYSDRFLPVVFNNLWGVIYLTVVNFILFEYAIPFVLRKRSTVLFNIIWGIFLLWMFMMLYS